MLYVINYKTIFTQSLYTVDWIGEQGVVFVVVVVIVEEDNELTKKKERKLQR